MQDGSVVSRTLLKAAGGTLTLFAFGAGEGLSTHATPHEAWIYALEGELRIRIEDTPHVVRAGSCLPLPAGIPHAVEAVTDARMLLVMLRRGSAH